MLVELRNGPDSNSLTIDYLKEVRKAFAAENKGDFIDPTFEPDLDLRPFGAPDPRQRGAAFTEIDAPVEVAHRQKLPVAPQAPGPRRQGRLEGAAVLGLEAIPDQPGGPGRRQERRRIEGGRRAGLAADQLFRPAFANPSRRTGHAHRRPARVTVFISGQSIST